MADQGWKIAIVGGGVGGLTLGLALREQGLEADIYEQTDELREVGAAVALSANGTRFFERIGLSEKFGRVAFDIPTLIYRDGRSGKVIGKHNGRPSYREQFGAPYWGIHRADLQKILSGTLGMERIHLNKRLVDLTQNADEVTLRFKDGSSAKANFVVGGDGARSTVRQWMLGYDDVLYSGCSAFRGIVAPELLDKLPDPAAIQFWMGPGGHLLHYPIGNGDQNFFVVERNPAPWPAREWTMPATEGEQTARYKDWHPAVMQMISAVPISPRWGLFHRPPLSRWSKGRVTLIGDAAHALVPHHGQGANQSIEDVVVLARCLAETNAADYAQAQDRYERLRRGRTRKVQYASITTADLLHLPDGPAADKRNARFATFEGMHHHLGWIHEFDPATQVPTDRQGGTWL
jgi:salicylate hydroxylase